MNPEKVLTMCTEKSVDIKDMTGGGIPEFTTDDARHALAHMGKAEFNYCQYVFLLYGDKALSSLMENTVLYIYKRYPKLKDRKEKKGLLFVINLCRMACEEQTKPAGKITDSERYTRLNLTRHEWRYKWKDIFIQVNNYLNELRQGVIRHIYLAINEVDHGQKK